MSDKHSMASELREICDRAGYYTKRHNGDLKVLLYVKNERDDHAIRVSIENLPLGPQMDVFDMSDAYWGSFSDTARGIHEIQSILSPIEETDEDD